MSGKQKYYQFDGAATRRGKLSAMRNLRAMNRLATEVRDRDAEGVRFDANTAFQDEQLAHVVSEMFREEYAPLRSAELMNIGNFGMAPGADSYKWDKATVLGQAEEGSAKDTEVPTTDEFTERATQGVAFVKMAYQYDVEEALQDPLSPNLDLIRDRQLACREAIQAKIDNILLLGSSTGGASTGFLNQAGVNRVYDGATVNGATIAGGWNALAANAGQTIISDFTNIMAAEAIRNGGGVVRDGLGGATSAMVDTLVMPSSIEHKLKGTFIDSGTGISVWQQLFGNDGIYNNLNVITGIENAATADKTGTGPRMVLYKNDATTLRGVVPLPYDEEPVQYLAYVAKVHAYARVSGFVLKHPLRFTYIDINDTAT